MRKMVIIVYLPAEDQLVEPRGDSKMSRLADDVSSGIGHTGEAEANDCAQGERPADEAGGRGGRVIQQGDGPGVGGGGADDIP